ncbi:MAG: hypothetical protein H6Q14_2846 [Bacteroidetes bacterium]|nr:hypothetical protein [Bacteroidota bacterium]
MEDSGSFDMGSIPVRVTSVGSCLKMTASFVIDYAGISAYNIGFGRENHCS